MWSGVRGKAPTAAVLGKPPQLPSERWREGRTKAGEPELKQLSQTTQHGMKQSVVSDRVKKDSAKRTANGVTLKAHMNTHEQDETALQCSTPPDSAPTRSILSGEY